MGRWGSKVPNFLVKITIQLFLLQTRFLGLCTKIGVAVGGWGSRVPYKYMEYTFPYQQLSNINDTKIDLFNPEIK